MSQEIDVLIHYADKYDETAQNTDNAWVTNFKKFLELMLYQVLGTRPTVVLKSEFDSATASKLNASVLVAILSKDFVQSGRCLDTVESFFKATADSKFNRVFKILKSP